MKAFQFDDKSEYEAMAKIINKHLNHYFRKRCDHSFIDIMNEYFGKQTK